MDISSISPTTSAYQLAQTNSNQNIIGQQFMQLEQALQSGDVSAAQSAYSTIQSSFQNSSSGLGALSGTSLSDFQAIGTALQSGDVSSAESALAALQQDAQAATGSSSGSGAVHHHHHHHKGQVNSSMAQQMSDLNSLGSALQSGSASSAQSAFSALLQDVQNDSGSSSLFSGNSQSSIDLQGIQSALQSNNLSAAQSSYAFLLQDLMPTSSSPYSTNQRFPLGNIVNVTA
ncbi:MAG TPA: hypothetical protein VLX91_17085 [Candidatus Acidoferrales bacterium]|nr:hypothetical protein [Candidatus Acidoferrales bacterium]